MVNKNTTAGETANEKVLETTPEQTNSQDEKKTKLEDKVSPGSEKKKEEEDDNEIPPVVKAILEAAKIANEERNKTPLIYQKIPTIMGKVGVVGKDRKNTTQGYQFRGIDDMYNALNKHLSEEKVFVTSEIIERTREERQTIKWGTLFYTTLRMKFKFYAEDGSSVESTTEGEAMDSGDKSTNKAMSTAYKYALMQIFCIPTEEDKDTETQSHEVLSKTKTETQPKKNETPVKNVGTQPENKAAANPKIISIEQKNKIIELYKKLGYQEEGIPARIEALEARYGKTLPEFTEGEARDVIKKMEGQVIKKEAEAQKEVDPYEPGRQD